MQQLRFLFALALVYMFRVKISPIIGSTMLYMATGKPAHLGCKFLLDVSVVNSPIVVEVLVITVLFCVVLPAGSTT